MAASLAPLSANHVGADIEAFLYVLRVSDHIHVEDACFMEAVDDVAGRDADGGDEEFGPRVDYNGYEVVEFTFCVIVARGRER